MDFGWRRPAEENKKKKELLTIIKNMNNMIDIIEWQGAGEAQMFYPLIKNIVEEDLEEIGFQREDVRKVGEGHLTGRTEPVWFYPYGKIRDQFNAILDRL